MGKRRLAKSAVLAAIVCASLAVPVHGATTKSGPVTYVTAKATIGASGTDTVGAECPGETSVSGGGGAFTSSPDVSDGVEVAGLYPSDGGDLDSDPDDLYSVDGAVGATVGSRTLRATAICLEPSDDPFALTYSSSPDAAGAGSSSTATFISCSSGELTTGGFETAAPNLADVEIEMLGLGFDGDQLNPGGSTISFSKENAAFSYTRHAVCSSYNLKHVYRTEVIFSGTETVKVACPKGRRVVGGGFGSFPVDTIASEPYDSKDKRKAPDDGWRFKLRASGSGPAAMYATASCLKN